MIKTIVVRTNEIDDIEFAIQSIKEQLDIENNLRKNSVGIIACHYEFITSGAVKAICEALPFDVAGAVTIGQAVNEESGMFLLSIMVLTSDEASFVVKLTPSLSEDPCGMIEKTYNEAASQIEGTPSLILPFAPFMLENSGDEYVDTFTRLSGGVPVFGTVSIDDTDTFENNFVIFNGENYRDRMAMILIYAEINPRFLIATISKDKILTKPALVTKSERHILKEVNGRPVAEYFEDLGLKNASEMQYAMSSLPFMLDYGDGTPQVSKVFIGRTSENYAICAGLMPEQSTIYIGVFDKDDVLFTTGEAIDKAVKDMGDVSCMLMYTCISRSMSLGGDSMAEMDLVRSSVGGKFPLLVACSGGEMCPTQISNSKAINRFHNNAFVICIL